MSTTNIVTITIIMLASFIIMPLGTIWAWNILFGSICSIAYTFPNWAAVILLGIFFRGIRQEKSSAQ